MTSSDTLQQSPFATVKPKTEGELILAKLKQVERKLSFLERKVSHYEAQLADWQVGKAIQMFPVLQKKPPTAHVPDHFATELLTWHLWRKGLPQEKPPADVERVFALTKVVIIAAVRSLARVLVECKLPHGFRDAHSEAQMLATVVRALTGLSESEFSLAAAEHAMKEANTMHLMAINIDGVSRRVFHSEPYVPLADNTRRSAAVMQSVQRFVDDTKKQWFLEDKDPFEKFKFSVDPHELAKLGRQECSKCRRRSAECYFEPRTCIDAYMCSEQLYCASCVCVVDSPLLRAIPPLKLPVRFDIVHHPAESPRKMTSLHGCVLSPAFCSMHEFPDHVPKFDPETAVVLFPSKDAVYLDEIKTDLSKIKTVVVVESTWQRANSVSNHPHLAHLRHIRIRDKESCYWRYQELGSTFLATLEAIYYTAVEFWEALSLQQQQQQQQSTQTTTTQLQQQMTSSVSAPGSGFVSGSIYDKTRHFDDLMLFYAAIYYRIGRRYGEENADGKRPPKSWAPQTMAIGELEGSASGLAGLGRSTSTTTGPGRGAGAASASIVSANADGDRS